MKPICGRCSHTMVETKGSVILQDHGIHRVKTYYCANGGCPTKVPTRVYMAEGEPYENAHLHPDTYAAELLAIIEDTDIEILNASPCECGKTIGDLLMEQEKRMTT